MMEEKGLEDEAMLMSNGGEEDDTSRMQDASNSMQVIDFLDSYNQLCAASHLPVIQHLQAKLQEAIDGGLLPKRFDLNGNNKELRTRRLNDDYAEILMMPLAGINFLQELDLSFNEIGDRGGRAIASFLKDDKYLRILKLNSNSIGPDGGIAIAKALNINETLQVIDISDNSIADPGGMEIAAMLQINTALSHIYMRGCNLAANSLIAIFTVLQNNQTIEFLDISNNESHQSRLTQSLQNDLIMHLSRMLKINRTIKTINLSKFGITDWTMADCLSAAIKANIGIRNLDLSCNRITRDGGVALCQALYKHAFAFSILIGGPLRTVQAGRPINADMEEAALSVLLTAGNCISAVPPHRKLDCSIVPDGLAACSSETTFRLCHNSESIPFDLKCPVGTICCNGECIEGIECVPENPCSAYETGIACVGINKFKHCANRDWYWEKPQKCAKGTLCCNDRCVHPRDAGMCVAAEETKKEKLKSLLHSAAEEDGYEWPDYLDLTKWEYMPSNWKRYVSLPSVVYRTHEVFVGGRVIGVWNFGFVSTSPEEDPSSILINRAIYPIYPNGTSAGSPIFESIPTETKYSDATLVYELTVESDEDLNKAWHKIIFPIFMALVIFKNFEDVFLEYEGELVTKEYRNTPIVPKGSQAILDVRHAENYEAACRKLTDSSLSLELGWYLGVPVWFMDLGEISSLGNAERIHVGTGNAVFDQYETITVDRDVTSEEEVQYTGFYRVYPSLDKRFKTFNVTELSEECIGCASRQNI
ncbi:hypothetical protein HDU67_004010 [Dinochytrium kinnereticum]|nr:hypothetical protein HDU67_004010 [Dinochytrium kinnereticum]